MISTNLIPPPHAPSPLTQQISFCSSNNGQSHLLKSTLAAFLLIAWKSIFRRGVVLWSHLRDHSFNRLSQFFTLHLILSDHFRLQTMRRFSMRTHLSYALHYFTNTFHFRAVHGYAAAHMHITHVLCFLSILPLPCG